MSEFSINETYSSIWKNNINLFLKTHDMKQVDFADRMKKSKATINGYCKGQLPTLEFLLYMKHEFPEISLDDLLTGSLITKQPGLKTTSTPNSELSKYYGLYSTFHLETKIVSNTIDKENHNFGDVLRYDRSVQCGILYIYDDQKEGQSLTANCIALFNAFDDKISYEKTFERMFSKSSNPKDLLNYLNAYFQGKVYTGTFTISEYNLFINLDQNYKDKAFIVLRKHPSSKDQYTGGLGTINSVSAGIDTDPITQIIGLVKGICYLSEDEIKKYLLFIPPRIDIASRVSKILEKAEEYKRIQTQDNQNDNASLEELKAFIPLIIQSNLTTLVEETISENLLSYVRIPKSLDDKWYKKIREAKEYYEKNNLFEMRL